MSHALEYTASLPAHLLLETAEYAIATQWQEYIRGINTVTTVEKTLRVSLISLAGEQDRAVLLESSLPALGPQEPSPLMEMLLLLSGLYQCLLIRLSATGQLVGLVNYDEIQRTWAAIKRDLHRRFGEGEMTTGIIHDVDALVINNNGQNLLDSLAHDYSYHALLRPTHVLGHQERQGALQARHFPQFYSGADIWFQETMTAAAADEGVTFRLQGRLDLTQTNLVSVAQAIQIQLGPNPPTVQPEQVRCSYEATHTLGLTGLPEAIELVARSHYHDLYRKEYSLSVRRI
jgi:hypothetical protein